MSICRVLSVSVGVTICLSASLFAQTALVLPGLHQSGVDLQGKPISAQQVLDWEIDHADIVFGRYADPSDNQRTNAIGYMYNQKMEINTSWHEHYLRLYAEQNGLNYEDFFLHFSQDTVIAEVDSSHGENTILNRRPIIVGYTASADHAGFWLYQNPPWDADVFAHADNQGALYVYHSEPFDRLTFKFSQFAKGGRFIIEYPSAIDSSGMVSEWRTLDIKNDKTHNMTRNQSIIWKLPSDWVRATTHDGSQATYGGGQYFGSTYLRDGGRLFAVRIRWNDTDIDNRPRLKEVKLKNSFPMVKLADAEQQTSDGQTITRWRKIKGFDHTADINGDNYLSSSEYKKRTNKQATARFRWESRVIPFGRMWNQTSSWALTHLANPDYLAATTHHLQANWNKDGLNGAYNDDTNKLLGPNQFYLYSGGHITELNAIAGSETADRIYRQQFSNFLRQLAVNTDALIGLNIGTANLYGRNGQSHLVDAGSLYLREHYLNPSTGFSGYSGLSKLWDNSALAINGAKVIFQATTRYGRVQFFGNSESNWKQDQYSSLAAFYLNSHTDYSFYNQWNSGYIYGSDNTGSNNFWRANVAKNIAYQPTHLLKIQLGQPLNSIPHGFEPISLMLSTSTPSLADYTIVGNSTMTRLVHDDLPNGMTELLPTYTYFVYQSPETVVSGGPQEMVLARDFEKGRVLYRTDFFGKSRDYFSAEPITVTLDPMMRMVDMHGNVGDYVDSVELSGYQGVILLH